MLALCAPAAPPPRAVAAAGAARALELRADEVTLRDGGAVVEAAGRVSVVWGTSRMRAARAVYTVRARRLSLAGEVTVTGPPGTLTAARATAVLAPSGGIVSVEAGGGVTLASGQRTVRAAHLTYEEPSGVVTADGGVALHEAGGVTARARSLLMRRGEAASLRGRARVQTADGHIEADQIDVSERAQTVLARGNVTGVFAQTRITAGAAAYDHGRRRAVFREAVRVTQPGRTIHADVVTISLQDRRVVAEGETTIRLDDEPGGP